MAAKLTTTVMMAALVGVLCAGSEAFARGHGGGHGHSGHSSRHSFSAAKSHNGHNRHISSRAHQPHGMQHSRDSRHASSQQHRPSSQSFGSHGRKWSSRPGEWHQVPGFGSDGHGHKSSALRRQWQAGGDGGGSGSICFGADCQGLWHEDTENRAEPLR